jgi:hypothetical protein
MESKDPTETDPKMHKSSIFDDTNKLNNMFLKLDKAKRSEASKVAATLDFFEDPKYLI